MPIIRDITVMMIHNNYVAVPVLNTSEADRSGIGCLDCTVAGYQIDALMYAAPTFAVAAGNRRPADRPGEHPCTFSDHLRSPVHHFRQ
ncbi:hypothetical protein D3C75_1154390 [compost metagenome]